MTEVPQRGLGDGAYFVANVERSEALQVLNYNVQRVCYVYVCVLSSICEKTYG